MDVRLDAAVTTPWWVCINSLGAHAQRGLRPSVRLSGTTYSGTVKTKRTSQYANGMAQILPVSSTVEAVEVTRRASMCCQKHYLPFKSYGVKTKRTSQYANNYGLPRPDSARFEHGGGSRSNTKGEYVILVCQKHYLPT